MALTADIEKIWPTLEGAGQIRIGVEVVLKDDDLEVRRAMFTTNTEQTGDPEIQAGTIISAMNEFIQTYKKEKTAHNHAKMNAFETAVIAGVQL